MTKTTAIVVAPGRGTYNKDELGYLHRHHKDKLDLVRSFDVQRTAQGQESILALDRADTFSVAKFTRGDNASALIHACAYADFLSIDRTRFDILGVTGNSMGWYIALTCGGGATMDDGFRIVNTMGTFMQDALIGGQMIYPFVDGDWRVVEQRKALLASLIDDVQGLYLSITLGGMIVLAGTMDALGAAEKHLPPLEGRFPMRLANHAAFHTPLQAPVAERGRNVLSKELFLDPDLPLIDGRGHIWWPKSTHLHALWDYTLGHQVTEPYDFTAAIRTSLREFAPDVFIILGPGSTLGGAVAQALIAENWRGLSAKADFIERQASHNPLILSMGLESQRRLVVNA